MATKRRHVKYQPWSDIHTFIACNTIQLKWDAIKEVRHVKYKQGVTNRRSRYDGQAITVYTFFSEHSLYRNVCRDVRYGIFIFKEAKH